MLQDALYDIYVENHSEMSKQIFLIPYNALLLKTFE